MLSLFTRKRTSSLALAVALATGGAVVTTAVMPAEASAQRAKRDRERAQQQQESDGGGYSDAFRAAYVPLDEALKAEGANVNALKPQIQALVPILNTNDEKIAGGGLIFNAGIAAQDRSLQLQGIELMIASGKVPAENLGRYNFIAYQLSNEANQYANSRTYLQGAIDNNFTTNTISAADMRIAMAESFFAEQQYDQGFNYLTEAINDRKAQGLDVAENWYRRGVTVAYENELPQVYDLATLWISAYPSPENWRDAVNLTRNLNTFQAGEMLDLFRLSRRVGALTDASDFDYYVEAADPRRLPYEVKQVIDAGVQAGVVSSGNLFITESLETANGRIAADRADLPALERDAMAAGAPLRTVAAAAGTFLSYGEYEKAETLYERALALPGGDTPENQMRLGIARIGLGEFDDARAALRSVTGNRTSIAKLWIAYANELEGTSGSTAVEAAVEGAAAAPEMTGS